MSRIARLRTGIAGLLVANVGARLAALLALALGTLLVARTGGATAVGIYALLRVLPGLVGVVISAGLPGAVTFFLAGPHARDGRLPMTVVAIMLIGGIAGTLLWAAATPLIGPHLFPGLSTGLLLVGGATVFTQLIVATAKSCSQGGDDMAGANLVIVNEELMFLPAYGLLWAIGADGFTAVVVGLLVADVLAVAGGWGRLARRAFFAAAERPSYRLGRDIAGYGMRQQVGGVMTLLNLRLDFILLSLLSGPAVLGVYAIASKMAELLKIPGMALTYVLYPQYAKAGPREATAKVRRLMPKATVLTAGLALPLIPLSALIIPFAYGHAFQGAVVPAQIIVVGLALDGLGGVITGYLYGVGRPGLNSWAMGAGLAVTVVLDLALIPPYGATGAAIASAVAYVTSTVALVGFYLWLERTGPRPTWTAGNLSEADAQ